MPPTDPLPPPETEALATLGVAQVRPIEATHALRVMRETLESQDRLRAQAAEAHQQEIRGLLRIIAELTLPDGVDFALLDNAQDFSGSHHYLIWRNADGTRGGAPVYDATAW